LTQGHHHISKNFHYFIQYRHKQLQNADSNDVYGLCPKYNFQKYTWFEIYDNLKFLYIGNFPINKPVNLFSNVNIFFLYIVIDFQLIFRVFDFAFKR